MKKDIAFGVVTDTVKKLLIVNLIFLAAMSVFRLVFFVYYGGLKIPDGLWTYVMKAFILGARFDLGVVAYISLLVTLTLIAAAVVKRISVFNLWLQAVKYYYVVMFSLALIILCIDFGFYSYFKNHINILIFGVLEDDTQALFSTLAENYNLPFVVLGFLVLISGIYSLVQYFISSIDPAKEGRSKYPFLARAALLGGLLIVNAAAARGSFGLFPLGTMDAEISPDVFINKIAINGIYTLQESLEARLKENGNYNIARQVGYENNDEQAFADFLELPKERLNTKSLPMNLLKKTPRNAAAEKLRPNVVLIMMEGFGSDLARYNSESFNVLGELKKHFDSDTLFMNFISGDVGTIGSIETVVLNMPKRPNSKAVTQSKYGYNAYFTGAGVPYKQADYDTIFLYGGNSGWRNVFAFAGKLGFDYVEGAGSMDPEYERNQWGVYDEFLFENIYKKLVKDQEKPKFIFAMTTSNHPPYSLPKGYTKLPLEVSDELKGRITGDRKLAQRRFETYQYANQKLGEFITKIKASPLADNTIIAVTGDHNFWSVFDYPKERYLDLDGVPFYIYIPEGLKSRVPDKNTFGSHLDIMPTLYGLSLSNKEFAALGADMLDPKARHFAFNADGLVMSKERALRYLIENNTISYYSWDSTDSRLLKAAEPDAGHEALLKHYRSALAVADHLLRNPFK